MAAIVSGWIVYDLLCRSPLGNNDTLLGVVMFILLTIAAWGLCQVFSGRGAYIHFGAILGTIMVANVFFVIIPGQRELVTAKQQGRDPDPKHGLMGKQRSVHNTYFTLPVLFVMISNHYAMTYGHEYNWLILIAISLAGALVRVYFVARHFGKPSLLPAGVAVLIMAGVVTAIMPPSAGTGVNTAQAGAADTFLQVQNIVHQHCTVCHAANPTQPGFTAAPKGVVFDSAQDIVTQAALIHQQSVVTKAMPIGNLTQITDAERAVLDQWFKAGAPTQ
jgi:uncharacterized membrane protein